MRICGSRITDQTEFRINRGHHRVNGLACRLGNAMHEPTLMARFGYEFRKFRQRHLVDIPLEVDNYLQWYPVFIPAPSIKLWMARGSQIHVAVSPRQLEQEPDLLLPSVVSTGIPADKAVGHFIAEPIASASKYADVIRRQPHLFVEFPIHRLLRRFAVLDTSLRELPRVSSEPFAPKHLVPLVEQDDADVGSEPLTVEHNRLQNSRYFHYCTALP